MILSENCVEVTSVSKPSITPAACLVMAGYVGKALPNCGEDGAIGRGIGVLQLSQTLGEQIGQFRASSTGLSKTSSESKEVKRKVTLLYFAGSLELTFSSTSASR